MCFGIVFVSDAPNYSYKLRFNISNNKGVTDGAPTTTLLTQDQALDISNYNKSLINGMIGANTLVLSGILDKETGSSGKTFKHFVSPVYQEKYTLDNIYTNIVGTLGILILLPLLLIYLRQTATMLNEKETRVRESMSIMGMKMGYYYFTWFVRYFAVYFVLHLICAAIFVKQMPKVPFYIPFILFLLFDIVLIVQNFFIQVFLSRAKIGVVIALLFFVIQYVISFLSTNSDNPTLSVNSALSIIPHAALIIAFNTLVYA